MQCFIYKSLKTEYLYLYLKKKDDFAVVPEALLHSMGRLEYVMALQLSAQRKLAQETAEKVMACLQEKGFFVQLPPKKDHVTLN